MTATQTLETAIVPSVEQQLQYELELERARERLRRHGASVLAVTGPEESPAHLLAKDLGLLEVAEHDTHAETLRASSVRETGIKIASILPYYVMGEGHIPYNGDGRSTLEVIQASRSLQIARVNLIHDNNQVAMAIVSSHNGIIQ